VQIAAGTLAVERTSECFGACHRAPMARVGIEYREHLDESARRALIAELAGG
jgi:NADH:ubiquinone oxidoreductase subunit E